MFSQLPYSLQMSVIEHVDLATRTKLLHVNKGVREMASLAGPLPKRLGSIDIDHESLLEEQGRLFSDDLRITFVPKNAGKHQFFRIQNGGEASGNRLILKDNHRSYRFLSRVRASKEVTINLGMDFPIGPPRSSPSDCYEFYKILPNLRHVEDLAIFVNHSSCLNGYAKWFPYRYEMLHCRDLAERIRFFNHASLSTPTLSNEQLRTFLENTEAEPKRLDLDLRTDYHMEDLEPIFKFQEIKLKFFDFLDLKRFLSWTLAYSGLKRFSCLEIYTVLQTDYHQWNHVEKLEELRQELEQFTDFRSITNYAEAVRGFTNGELGWEICGFETRNRVKQLFYRKPISPWKELVVMLGYSDSGTQARVNVIFRCRKIQAEEKVDLASCGFF